MRTTLPIVIALATAPACGPSYALEPSDAMSSWKAATSKEKAKLVQELSKMGGRGDQTIIINCVDAAAAVSGHSQLQIRQIVEACMSSKDNGQPV